MFNFFFGHVFTLFSYFCCSGVPEEDLEMATCSQGKASTKEQDVDVGRRFMKLPIDIQIPILKFLPKESLQIMLTEVPKLYEILTLDKSLWETIELNGMVIRTGRACKLITKAPHYTKVVIANRNDLNKLIKILLRSPRCVHLTSLSFVDCHGSESTQKPFVKGFLVYQLVKSCPLLNSFELRGSHMKSVLLYNYLGKNCLNFYFLHSTLIKGELEQFLKNAPVSSLELMDDESISGAALVKHITDRFSVYGAFMINVVEDKYKVSFSNLSILSDVEVV